jgi:hypothetical protein
MCTRRSCRLSMGPWSGDGAACRPCTAPTLAHTHTGSGREGTSEEVLGAGLATGRAPHCRSPVMGMRLHTDRREWKPPHWTADRRT